AAAVVALEPGVGGAVPALEHLDVGGDPQSGVVGGTRGAGDAVGRPGAPVVGLLTGGREVVAGVDVPVAGGHHQGVVAAVGGDVLAGLRGGAGAARVG